MQLRKPVVKPTSAGILDVVLAFYAIKETYLICRAFQQPDKPIDAHPMVEQAITAMNALGQILVQHIGVCLKGKAKECLQKLHAINGMGDIIAQAHKQDGIMQDIDYWVERVQRTAQKPSILIEGVFGTHLFETVVRIRSQAFIDFVMTFRNRGKFTDEQVRQIDQALIEFKQDDEYTKLNIPYADVEQLLNFSQEFIETLSDAYGLKEVMLAFKALMEAVKVNQGAEKHRLTEDNHQYFQECLKDYSKEKRGPLKPEVVHAVASLANIRPILSFSLSDCQLLLNAPFAACWTIILKDKISSTQVFKTYEALGLAANSYYEMVTIFEIMKSQMAAKREQKQQLEHFQECYANYFQLTMRFVMPLGEALKAYGSLSQRLQKREVSATQNELIVQIQRGAAGIDNFCDFLRQKSTVINALRDATDYAKKLQDALNTEPKGLLGGFFFSYKPLLVDMKIYFDQIRLSSRVEEFANFRAILAQITSIFARNKYQHDPGKDPAKCSTEEALLLEIYKRYSDNVSKYQLDVSEARPSKC